MTKLQSDIERAVESWPVPGLACSVVAQDRVAFSRGFGLCKLGDAATVDEYTLFAIGSVSKSFTGTAVAMLVDEGLISWDSRVIDHLRDFYLFDPYVTRELTVRDLLTHRVGLERGDFMWLKSGYNSSEVMRRIRYLAPSSSFRAAFGYQNIMYLAAGELVRALTGRSWEEFIKERIFVPLGMTKTRSSIKTVDPAGNLACPHLEITGQTTVIGPHKGLNVNPAGSIYSNAHDMACWLRFHLGDGMYDRERLLTSGSLQAIHTPEMFIAYSSPWSEMFPDSDFLSYGAGWFIARFHGRKVMFHGGNIDGMAAAVCVVPEERFGISVLTNVDGSLLPRAIVYRALDEIFGRTSRKWLREFRDIQTAAMQRLEYTQTQRSQRLSDTTPSRPLGEYVGIYSDPFYGRADVRQTDAGLYLDFIGWRGLLEHWQLDMFRLRPEDPYLRKYSPEVRFDLDDFGKPSRVTLILLGSLRLSGDRVPAEAKAVQLSTRKQRLYEGTYVLGTPPMRLYIEVLQDTLKATIPGALVGTTEQYAVVTLSPIGAARFIIRGTSTVIAFRLGKRVATYLTIESPHQQPFEFRRGN